MSCHQTEMLVTDRKARQGIKAIYYVYNRKCLAAAYQLKGFNVNSIPFIVK